MTPLPDWTDSQRDAQEQVRRTLLAAPKLTSVELACGSGVILSVRGFRGNPAVAEWPRLCRVSHRALGVAAAGWGGPPVPAGPGLGDGPARGLLDPMASAAARSAVAGAGPAALVVGEGVLEVAAARVPGAGREGALAVPDLDQVPQRVAGPVAVRLVPVVAAGDRHRAGLDGELPAAGRGE